MERPDIAHIGQVDAGCGIGVAIRVDRTNYRTDAEFEKALDHHMNMMLLRAAAAPTQTALGPMASFSLKQTIFQKLEAGRGSSWVSGMPAGKSRREPRKCFSF